MGDLVILKNNAIVALIAITDTDTFDPLDQHLLFVADGHVNRFVKQDKAYIAVFNAISDEFKNYYSEKNFWALNIANNTRNDFESNIAKLGSPFLYLDSPIGAFDDNANVFICYKSLSLQLQDNNISKLFIDTIYRKFPYSIARIDPANVNNLSTVLYPVVKSSRETYTQLSPYYDFILKKKTIDANGNLIGLDEHEQNTLLDIVQVLDYIYTDDDLITFITTNNLIGPFDAHLALPTRYNSIPFNEIDPLYHPIYNAKHFGEFRLALIDFKYWLLSDKDDGYEDISIDELAAFIINIFPVEELSKLDYDVKINLLNKIVKNNWWIIGDWYFNKINQEQAIVKIVRSIYNETNGEPNYSEINDFFDLLNSIYDYKKNESLYEILYDSVSDPLLYGDDGTGSRGQLVKAIYSLWLDSKFNPNHIDHSVGDGALSYFNYTNYSASWQFDDPNISSPILDGSAAPPLFSYESEKIALWYADNLTFFFIKGTNNILVQTDASEFRDDNLVGVYQYFQPVALKASDSEDTIIKMPVKGISDTSDPLNNANFINNCIPIFYLKYIDDLGDYSDAKETIGAAVNVVLTFTGASELSNIRYLKDLSLLKNLASGLTLEEEALLWRAVGYVTSSAQTLSGITSFIYQYATNSCAIYYTEDGVIPLPGSPEYDKYTFCQTINTWLFVLEMVSLSADLLTKRMLKRASQKVLSNMTPEVSEAISPADLQALEDLADLATEVDNFLSGIQSSHPQVYAKVKAIRDDNVSIASEFVFDFKGNDDALNKLEANVNLVDNWVKCDYVKPFRRNTLVLEAYEYLKSPTVINKLREFTDINGKWQGGHLEVSMFDQSKSIYGVLDNNAAVDVTTHAGITYKQVKKTSITMHKGAIFKRKKGMHTWVTGLTEEQFLQDVAVAFGQKGNGIVSAGRTTYYSYFSSKCPVTLIVEDEILINNVTYKNHLSAILINP